MVREKKPDVIAIVESWLNEDIFDSEMVIEDYNFVRMDRKNEHKTRGGGVIIYISQQLTFINVTSEEIENIDYIWVKIKGVNVKTVTLGVFYRPPDSDEEQLRNLIRVISKFKTSRTVLIGDFNFRDINWKNCTSGRIGKEFLKSVSNLALQQCVKKVTRGDSLLDLVLVYEKNFVYNLEYLPPIGMSDHDSLLITLNVRVMLQTKTFNTCNYNKANYKILEDQMRAVDWEIEIERLSVNEYWNMLIKLLNDFKEDHVPKLYGGNKNETPWFKNSLKKLIKKRNNLYKRFRKTGHSYFRIKYRQARNKVTKLIKIAKGKYESKIIKRSRNNRKIFYAYVNNKNRKGSGKKVESLVKNETGNGLQVLDGDAEMATILDKQFLFRV